MQVSANLQILFLITIVFFASIASIATVATFFNVPTFSKMCRYIQSENLSLDINETMPCRPIDDDGGP